MPRHLAGYLDRWRKLHPRWKFQLWTPETTPALRHQEFYDHPEAYSPLSNPWQWRSDLARYEILHEHGGVYVDADLEPLRRIDELVEGCEAVIAREDGVFVNNAFVGSAPGSRFLADVLDGLAVSVAAQPGARVNRQVGAHYLTRVVRRHPEVRVLPAELIYPMHWSELDQRGRPAPQAYTRHHWHNRTTITGATR